MTHTHAKKCDESVAKQVLQCRKTAVAAQDAAEWRQVVSGHHKASEEEDDSETPT